MRTPLVPIYAVIVRHSLRKGQPLVLSVHDDLVAARKAARDSIRKGVHAHVDSRMRPARLVPLTCGCGAPATESITFGPGDTRHYCHPCS